MMQSGLPAPIVRHKKIFDDSETFTESLSKRNAKEYLEDFKVNNKQKIISEFHCLIMNIIL